MRPKVWFTPIDDDSPESVGSKTARLADMAGMADIAGTGGLVGILQHVGERDNVGHVKPQVTRAVADEVRKSGGHPFLTGSATLYRGRRSNAPDHIMQAYDHGFTPDGIGCPMVMCDGVVGADRVNVPVAGAKHCETAHLGSGVGVMDALVVVSHPTGHPSAGYAAAIKNVAMGLSCRGGKLAMHHGGRPEFVETKCTGCGRCAKWCPEDAITVGDVACVDGDRCIGCGQCLAVCPHDAIGFQWAQKGAAFQERLVEYCAAVRELLGEAILYVNVIQHFQEGCDCFGVAQPAVCPDVGIVVSRDMVAADKATADLLVRSTGRDLAGEIGGDYMPMLAYAETFGLGSRDYELVEC
jgi:uncharacterized Fe-S center protein